MRAGTADAFGAPVKTKTFEAKLVKATAGGIVARAEADADLNLRCALPDRGARQFRHPLSAERWPHFYAFTA
jgi:hypothetical protein